MTARVLEMVSLFLRKTMEEGLEGSARDDLVDTLVEQGHNPNEINVALSIVEKIQQRLDSPMPGAQRPCHERFFLDLEEFHLPPEVRGYLNQLVGMGVLDPLQREDIIERTLLMEPEDVTLEEVEYLVEETLAGTPKTFGEFDETISDFYH
jgi:uncharacterized protein Smg (DUF494 family)